MKPLPLPPLYGYTPRVPSFLFRPGSYRVLKTISATEALLWGTIYSRQVDRRPYANPCIQTRAQLAATINVGERSIYTYIGNLKRVGLLFEVNRGRERGELRERNPARWALNPLEVEKWRPKLESQIAELAEHDGRSAGWFANQIRRLDLFQARSELLGSRLLVDCGISPTKPRRKPRGDTKKQPRPQNLHASQNLPGRVVFTPPEKSGV